MGMSDSDMLDIRSCGFLVMRAAPRPSFLLMDHHHRLDLPKGHVDPGETDLECALRELWEETGIQADDIAVDPQFRWESRYPVRDRRNQGRLSEKTLVIFLAKLLRPVEIVPTEHPDFDWHAWSPPHAIQERTIDPLLAKVLEHLGPQGPTARWLESP